MHTRAQACTNSQKLACDASLPPPSLGDRRRGEAEDVHDERQRRRALPLAVAPPARARARRARLAPGRAAAAAQLEHGELRKKQD